MHEILHMIGLCPDNLTHPDLLDFFLLQKEDFGNLYQNTKLYVRRSLTSLQRYVYTVLS